MFWVLKIAIFSGIVIYSYGATIVFVEIYTFVMINVVQTAR